MHEYITNGTCAIKIKYEVSDGKLHNVRFAGGCDGNLKAIGALVEGMDTKEALKRLKGIQCGKRGTSCADQLAKAIEKNL